MEKRWKLLNAPQKEIKNLQEKLGIHPAICKLLVQRKIYSFEEARAFFRPQLSELHNPFLMKDMQKAVDRIVAALQAREKIMVFGDYDVDGTTAVACLFQFLLDNYESDKIDYYIPHRYKEGYGISQKGIDLAHATGVTLIISVDCGIKSVDLIGYAKELGIDFIVCDHHMPDAQLPPATAILNPKQSDCPYPYKELCGCGVGFKLITALCQHMQMPDEYYLRYLDLVVTAIAADIVPITGENRVLAFFGLKRVNEHPSPGIKALIQLSKIEHQTLTINNLIYVIAPRVNAAGRMDDARLAVQLFIEKDPVKSASLAEQLHSHNDDRKEADLSITVEAMEMIENDLAQASRRSTVVYQPHWHKGVVGIVASRLIDKFYRPTVVLTQSGDIVAGSARSVAGFNLYEAIHACREHLLGYGGHFAAAGMTLLPDQVPAFREKFEAIVAATIGDDQLIPEIVIDAEVRLQDLKTSFYNILCQMEPFGPENTRPIFLARQVKNNGWSKIVKEQHIKFSLVQDSILFNGIGFGLADKFHLLENEKPVDIVFSLDENDWNGSKHLQLRVIDLRASTAGN
ncbi:single-stranded-DNA-specific exonuclease RecJ [Flavihumibacter sp. CACIAM 22H1]|uniref:single-stranded-DNA-specific exonuclease RecJ n=1 Tax=Flavihumibacter sp. CACIAM 22H1 TaxID=1812911 RepID=UPI0007A920EE|nr:single-stranded-DNA-specific exonuclease RecJ [Flavihumibacter sp. CACIAM 22H1]KYP14694.1 MAG: single-stranded-DNA-specific exonuclease RecJ [Flavihumibacter sp. CACIAM 22H1]